MLTEFPCVHGAIGETDDRGHQILYFYVRAIGADEQTEFRFEIGFTDVELAEALRGDGHQRPQIHYSSAKCGLGIMVPIHPLEPDAAPRRGCADQVDG